MTDVAAALEEIRAHLVSVSRVAENRIALPVHGFQDDRLGYYLPNDAGNPAPGQWCMVYRERGQNEVRSIVASEDELLWLLSHSMLQSAATSWEVAHRVPHQDSRRGWFAKMTEWTAAYWPQWSARLEAHQSAILAQAPFDDDNTVFVEFIGTLPQPEKQAVWRLRGDEAGRVRSAVLDLFGSSGSLPSRDAVEQRSGISLRV